jgi:hypothetical protein
MRGLGVGVGDGGIQPLASLAAGQGKSKTMWTFEQIDAELHAVIANAITNCKGEPNPIEVDITVTIIEELVAENPGVIPPAPQSRGQGPGAGGQGGSQAKESR